MAKSLLSHRDVFEILHDKYVEVARDVWLAAKTLADIVKMIMNAAVVAGLSALAGWALSATGVGAGISWGIGAFQYKRIVDLWGDATNTIARVQTAITGFVALCTTPDSITFSEIKPLPIPAIDYDHPGVAPEAAGPR